MLIHFDDDEQVRRAICKDNMKQKELQSWCIAIDKAKNQFIPDLFVRIKLFFKNGQIRVDIDHSDFRIQVERYYREYELPSHN